MVRNTDSFCVHCNLIECKCGGTDTHLTMPPRHIFEKVLAALADSLDENGNVKKRRGVNEDYGGKK